ncbi:DUF6046 domain-containing protein [Chitinophaga tropicalis]|uniref:DUF6046 domain-containing protein n=1 Tax=Chitinophaga tropicalis TaxID=2683588 RepID=A0A7K1U689_9BACT|nr:DUF6046 domain-containing protein [Chitinophaga tropicalis]MVT09881.1 hypothetical protein [Chitinophaga tropicalis]
MAASFDIQKIFQTTWGYTPPVFNIAKQPENPGDVAQYFAKGLHGRSYFMPVTLGGTVLPNPVIRITSKKTIVETVMVNRMGTVKELIGQEDFKINIKGIIVSEDNSYPAKEIKAIHDLYILDTSLEIVCVLTDIFMQGKNTVVITDISWPEISGTQNIKTYEINLVSDWNFDLNEI